jgi:hypothetical protein
MSKTSQNPYKTSGFCLAKKSTSQTGTRLTRILQKQWKNKPGPQNRVTLQKTMPLGAPTGHKRFSEGTLVKPIENSVPQGRSVWGSMDYCCPSEHEHGLQKYLINHWENSGCRTADGP